MALSSIPLLVDVSLDWHFFVRANSLVVSLPVDKQSWGDIIDAFFFVVIGMSSNLIKLRPAGDCLLVRYFEATSKPNASTIRELDEYVHKICTRGLGLELNF
jgi:hypothetical protein